MDCVYERDLIMNQKPKNCTHPDCFKCPYKDCRYDRLEVEDFTETNNRDYFLHEDSTGRKLHYPTYKAYRNARQTAYARRKNRYRDRHEYNQKYYAEHGEEIKEKKRSEYNAKKNTRKCRKWRKKHMEREKERQRQYYLRNREKKLAYAKQRYEQKKQEMSDK